jgi:hypothetical protein
MRNRFLFYSRYLLGLLVFLFALSFTVGMVYGEEFDSRSGLATRIAQKGILLSEDNPRIRAAIETQNRHTERLMGTLGVVGTATGVAPGGEPVVRVFTSRPGIPGIPKILDGFPVDVKVTGKIFALTGLDNPWWWERPVPIGVSTGNEGECSAGTIGARVRNGSHVFALSNNHVYATENAALLGSDVLQPGLFDTNCNKDDEDVIGTLYDFEPIDFCYYFWFWQICPDNTIDAAIALSSRAMLGNATPDDGYGTPQPTTTPAAIGQEVQKYGRTTSLTKGTITAINATFSVGYSSGTARFVNQIVVESEDPFIGPGDSGSLLVTDPDCNPVGLIFAGNEPGTLAIANHIYLVLDRFGVTIDDETIEPFTDIALTSVSAPASVFQGASVDVVVTVENVGNQNVTGDIIVDLISDNTASTDGSDDIKIGEQTISGLAEGGSLDLTFPWNTTGANIGNHILTACHYLDDRDPNNDDKTTTVNLVESLVDVAVTDVSAPASVVEGDTDVSVVVRVGNVGNQEVTGDIIVDLVSDNTTPIDVNDDIKIGEQSINGLTEDGSVELTFSWDTTDATIGSHTLQASHDLSDDVNTNDVGTTTVEVGEPLSGPQLRTGIVTASTDGWVTVDLGEDYDYNDMVVICTPNYDNSINAPVVAQVQNVTGHTFDVKLAPAVGGKFSFENWEADVHWMVVEAGVYNEGDHGVKMEAVKFTSTVTDGSGSWLGESRSYAQTYTRPVVVGQVMTYNCEAVDRCNCTVDDPGCYWTVFWSRSGSSSKNPPNSTIKVGKHVGEDPREVGNETIGYVVIEAGSGSIDSTEYVAGLGSDSIRGMGNRPPYTYSLGDLSFTPSTAIVSQAAMDGTDGGWAVLYGTDWFTGGRLSLAIEEDWVWDTERRHTNEQVAYILFD